MRDMGVERLRLAVDWHGESGRKGNALTGGARWSVTEEGRRRGGSCLAEMGQPRNRRRRASGPRGGNAPAAGGRKKACSRKKRGEK